MSHADAVAAHAAQALDHTLATLAEYLTIPAISCDPTHAADVRRLAERVAADLTALGMSGARVLELPDALPCVAAEWMGAGPDAPTVLIYGHMDLQPVAGESWLSPPHAAEVRDGRMYARGAADDLGGWVSHMAALKARSLVVHRATCGSSSKGKRRSAHRTSSDSWTRSPRPSRPT